MLENLYTTKMSSNKKVLQKRFTKIRTKSGRLAKLMSLAMTLALVFALTAATVVMAALGNEEKNFTINGKGYAITPVLIENSLSTHTDSYYVRLRDTFEALGYEVRYDVDKSKYLHLSNGYTFPVYDHKVHIEGYDDEGEKYVIDSNEYEWQKQLVTNEIDYYIYGATFSINEQLPIIEMTKNGKTEYCQIGSRKYSSAGGAAACVIIDGKAYIPLRAVANIIGGIDNVKWNDEKHDTYYEGALTFDEETMTVNVTLEE